MVVVADGRAFRLDERAANVDAGRLERTTSLSDRRRWVALEANRPEAIRVLDGIMIAVIPKLPRRVFTGVIEMEDDDLSWLRQSSQREEGKLFNSSTLLEPSRELCRKVVIGPNDWCRQRAVKSQATPL